MNDHPDRHDDNTTGRKKRKIPRHLQGDALALAGGIMFVILIIVVIFMINGG